MRARFTHVNEEVSVMDCTETAAELPPRVLRGMTLETYGKVRIVPAPCKLKKDRPYNLQWSAAMSYTMLTNISVIQRK